MKNKFVGIALAAFSAVSFAGDFTPVQKALYVSAQAATVLDWSQTRYIAKNPDKFQEVNPLIGKNPSTNKVDAFMALRLVGNHLVVGHLPDEYRTPSLVAMNAVYWGVVLHNNKIGVQFDNEDKLKHAGLSFSFGALAKSVGYSDLQAFSLAMIPGTLKEISDSRGGSGWSNHDMVANAVGAFLGVKTTNWFVKKQGSQIVVGFSKDFY